MTDLAKIKTQLEEKLRELTSRAEEIEDDLSELGDDDANEGAIESADDEVLDAVGNVTLKEIREAKSAIAAIDAGTYGLCTSCNSKIAKERLKALPFTTKCTKCA